MIEAAGAMLAWLGASLIVLADGRRGLALGLAGVGVGLCMTVWQSSSATAAVVLALGGVIAAAQRARNGTPGWAIMPPGSTPRLVLCVASGLVALWFGAAVTSGGGASLRIALLAVIGMTGARVFASRQPDVALSGVAGLALAVAAASTMAAGSTKMLVIAAGALIAVGSSFIRLREPGGA